MFTIGALVHLFGITFYGVFACGELQDWAEPPVQEQTVWSPTKAGYTEETSFVSSTFLVCFLVYLMLIFALRLEIIDPVRHQNVNTIRIYVCKQNEGTQQTIQINGNLGTNYGATGNASTNPFAASASMVTENVQPEARDVYMHGTADDRSY